MLGKGLTYGGPLNLKFEGTDVKLVQRDLPGSFEVGTIFLYKLKKKTLCIENRCGDVRLLLTSGYHGGEWSITDETWLQYIAAPCIVYSG